MGLYRVYAPRQLLAACSPGAMLTSFLETGMVRLEDVFLPSLVECAQREICSRLASDECRSRLPRYNSGTGVGYVAPGMDGLIHTGPLKSRRAYDYRPSAFPEREQPGLALRPLYEHLARLGESVLEMLNPHFKRPLTEVCGGKHLLKAAFALNAETDPEREIFPSHRDFSMLTLFLGGAPPGLQVLYKDAWVDVVLEPHEVLLGAGSFFKRFCPAATVLQHRVMASTPNRFSFSFFVELPESTLLPNGETVAAAVQRLTAAALGVQPA